MNSRVISSSVEFPDYRGDFEPEEVGAHGSRRDNVTALVACAFVGLVGWQVVSLFSGLLPGLLDIIRAVPSVFGSDTFFTDFGVTLLRVLIVWIAATVLGASIGVGAGMSWWFHDFVRAALAVALAVPDVMYIILFLLILGTGQVSGLLALTLAITPLVVNVTLGATLARRKELDEMARSFRFSRLSYIRHVLLWQVRPAVEAATRTAFSFAWKLMVLLEVLSYTTGVGSQIDSSYYYLKSGEMVVYAMTFIILMKLIELALEGSFLKDSSESDAGL